MFGPDDLEQLAPKVDVAAGLLRVRGLGYVETSFITLGQFPLFPVDSMLVLRMGEQEQFKLLPRIVRRSVLLAFVRRWGGLVALVTSLLVVAVVGGGWALPWELAVGSALSVLAFGASWWPLGTASHLLAREVSAGAGLPTHVVDEAYGVITAEECARLHEAWTLGRAEVAAKKRGAYEEGLRALKQRRKRRGRRAAADE